VLVHPDLEYAMNVLLAIAREVLGEEMAAPARRYEEILRRERLEVSVADHPQVFVSLDDSWTNLTIRYLVAARERRRWKSLLAQRVMEELSRPEHADRVLSVFPRRQIQFIGPDGRARELPWWQEDPGNGRQVDREAPAGEQEREPRHHAR